MLTLYCCICTIIWTNSANPFSSISFSWRAIVSPFGHDQQELNKRHQWKFNNRCMRAFPSTGWQLEASFKSLGIMEMSETLAYQSTHMHSVIYSTQVRTSFIGQRKHRLLQAIMLVKHPHQHSRLYAILQVTLGPWVPLNSKQPDLLGLPKKHKEIASRRFNPVWQVRISMKSRWSSTFSKQQANWILTPSFTIANLKFRDGQSTISTLSQHLNAVPRFQPCHMLYNNCQKIPGCIFETMLNRGIPWVIAYIRVLIKQDTVNDDQKPWPGFSCTWRRLWNNKWEEEELQGNERFVEDGTRMKLLDILISLGRTGIKRHYDRSAISDYAVHKNGKLLHTKQIDGNWT